MKRKILALVMIMVLSLTLLAGCGGDIGENGNAGINGKGFGNWHPVGQTEPGCSRSTPISVTRSAD